LEEREPELRETPRHATQEDRLGDRVAGGREMSDVVVDEARRRVPQTLAAARAVEGRRNAELTALRSDRVVVVVAVERQHVVPDRESRAVGIALRARRDAPRHTAAEHAYLRAELSGDELELLDRLVRRVHRDGRGGGQAVAQAAGVVGGDDVVRANDGPPGGVVA